MSIDVSSNVVPFPQVPVHAKKAADIQNWFEMASKKRELSILLVSGPAGCGKTNVVRIAAKNSKYDVKEWIQPVDTSNSQQKDDTSSNNAVCDEQRPEPLLKAFRRFLVNSLRYKPLICNGKRTAVLVKDFPNTILSKPAYLHEILNELKTHIQSVVIFIFTDSKVRKFNLVNSVFPSSFCKQNSIHRVSFNSIDNSLMKKGVERVISANHQKDVDFCTKTSHGDIRHALLNLQFSSAKDQTKATNKGTAQPRCDQFMNLTQAVGFILNPKCDQEHFGQSIEKIVDEYSYESEFLIRSIHSSYVAHLRSTDHLSAASNFISLSDVFFMEFFDKLLPLLALSICVPGIMAVKANPLIGLRSARGFFRR